MPIRQTTLVGDIFNLNSPSSTYNQALQDHYDLHGTFEDVLQTNNRLDIVNYATNLATSARLIEAYLASRNVFKNKVQTKTTSPNIQHLALVELSDDTTHYVYSIEPFNGEIPEDKKQSFFDSIP